MQQHCVSWPSMLAMTGLAIGPVIGLSGYAITEAWEAKEKALGAIVEAKSARPYPFTSIDGARMEQKLIDRDTEIIRQCESKVARLEDAIVGVESRCLDRVHEMVIGLDSKYQFKK